ncbi:hypothetical protein KZZ52_46050 [Dactylosporangium sp. AC04546]|uniref:hypothetical protein n=1 Tax=Dactylosporangium sp. AC04546 TaxID=2862460 RepID=UPI001EE0D5E0|nr:hypothetical protein [Dactylosporangium sp. AC04546]WVK81279.1 hypothetical protein KZZ52_46050 [Dactylosporangium sp. AC04546]
MWRDAPVRVEVLIVGARDAAVYYRRACAPLPRDTHPDAVAADLAAAPAGSPVGGARRDGPQPGWAPPALTILHSTSWRFEAGGVVLTYAAVLDGAPTADFVPLASRTVIGSGDPAAPSPAAVPVDAVAVHALRHLAWLRERDEVAAAALVSVPALWAALDDFTPAPAGCAPSAAREHFAG